MSAFCLTFQNFWGPQNRQIPQQGRKEGSQANTVTHYCSYSVLSITRRDTELAWNRAWYLGNCQAWGRRWGGWRRRGLPWWCAGPEPGCTRPSLDPPPQPTWKTCIPFKGITHGGSLSIFILEFYHYALSTV